MIQQCVQQCLDCWEDIYPGVSRPAGFDCVLQSRSQVILFWFPNGSKSRLPALVSKVSRTADDNPRMVRCAELVCQLRAKLTGDLLATVPKTVLAGYVEGLAHLVMPFAAGQPMVVARSGRQARPVARQHIRAFSSWLLELQRQTRAGQRRLDLADWSGFLAQALGCHLQDSRAAADLGGALAAELAGVSMPIAWRFGDAHHSNLLMRGGTVVAAVDWAGIKQEQWVIHDWFQFLYMYAVEFFKKNCQLGPRKLAIRAIDTLMGVEDSWLTDLFEEETGCFLDHYGLGRHLARALFMAFLAEFFWPSGKVALLERAVQIYTGPGFPAR